MSEEMKMILALIDYLGLEIRCTGRGVPDNSTVNEARYARDKRGVYDYDVRVKP